MYTVLAKKVQLLGHRISRRDSTWLARLCWPTTWHCPESCVYFSLVSSAFQIRTAMVVAYKQLAIVDDKTCCTTTQPNVCVSHEYSLWICCSPGGSPVWFLLGFEYVVHILVWNREWVFMHGLCLQLKVAGSLRSHQLGSSSSVYIRMLLTVQITGWMCFPPACASSWLPCAWAD